MALKRGDKVTCSAEYDVNGTHLASLVRKNTWDVIQVGGKNLPDDRIVIGTLNPYVVIAAVKLNTLTPLSQPAPVPPTPAPEPPPKVPEVDANAIAQNVMNSKSTSTVGYLNQSIGDGSVQLPGPFGKANESSEGGSFTYMGAVYDRPTPMTSDQILKLDQSHPSIVQNNYGFPKSNGLDVTTHKYKYNYYMDYEEDNLLSDMPAIRKSINNELLQRNTLYQRYVSKYNKFKIMNANDLLTKSFAHVFFVRPNCNIFKDKNTLQPFLKENSEFYYALNHCPEMLRSLTQSFQDNGRGVNHQFALYLSNKARSFEISDEYINSDTYGTALTGYKIPYGKHNIDSKNAKEFNIKYVDDRDLHIYNMHKLWTEYISLEFRGKVSPKDEYILNKILDYATCVYYFLTAEDGSTIIFWSKYWGVFPVESPSSSFSYSADSPGGVSNPELTIQYKYAFKEDFNPLTIVEFNTHCSAPFTYINPYQEFKAGTGYTWSGPPFVETRSDDPRENKYTFKLRFRPIDY